MIDEAFYKTRKAVRLHHDHWVWGPGKKGAAADDVKVKADYEKAGKPIEPLGIHGTYVAVDWDDCIGRGSCLWICSTRQSIETKCEICEKDACILEGSCLWICPTLVFEWAKEPGSDGQNDGLYHAKSDPVREADCIFCMACVTGCPTQAIKVDEALVEVHNTQMSSH